MIKAGLLNLLKHDADLSAVVGPRVRIGRIPEGTSYPVIVFHSISSEHFVGLQGVNATQARIFQFDCWDKTPRGADMLAQLVHDLLDGYRGTLSDGTTVLSSIPTGDVDLDDEELKLSGIAVDFKIFYTPGDFVPGDLQPTPRNPKFVAAVNIPALTAVSIDTDGTIRPIDPTAPIGNGLTTRPSLDGVTLYAVEAGYSCALATRCGSIYVSPYAGWIAGDKLYATTAAGGVTVETSSDGIPSWFCFVGTVLSSEAFMFTPLVEGPTPEDWQF